MEKTRHKPAKVRSVASCEAVAAPPCGARARRGHLGGEVAHVRPGSPAERIGLRPGDRVLAVNGHPIRDVLDYQFYAGEDEVEITFTRGGCKTEKTLRFSEDLLGDLGFGGGLGIEFAEATFDGVRRCHNQCVFCFIDQLPKGLRRSLYVKDDDYRYSFLYGNFVTLTNLADEDWARLAEQRLSPLHVSVHATDAALRRRILRSPNAPDVMSQLKRLDGLGVSFHAQVVLCPGLNDGPALDQTIADLVPLFPRLQSIGIVPVAVGEHTPGLRAFAPEEVAAVIEQIEKHQRRVRREYGRTIVHLADEFYLLADHPVPASRSYDGFVQYENGIGMVRVLLDDLERLKRKGRSVPCDSGRRFTVVSGRLIAPVMRRVLDEIESLCGFRFDLVPVRNRLFGEHVTVSGLLGGAEVIDELRSVPLGNAVFLPRSMLDADGHLTLDGIARQEFESRLGIIPVRFASSIAEMLRECELQSARELQRERESCRAQGALYAG